MCDAPLTIMRYLRRLAVLLLLGPLLPLAEGRAQEPPAERLGAAVPAANPAEAPEPEPLAPLDPPKASQIARRLEQTSAKLRSLHVLLGEDAGREDIAKSLPPLVKRLEELTRDQDDLLQPAIGLKTLQDLENEWKDARLKLSAWRETLTSRGARLDEILSSLSELSEEWTLVQKRSTDEELPEAVIQRVDMTLAELSATEEEVRTRRGRLLEVQNSVSEELVDVGSVLDMVERARAERRERLLFSDDPPIWTVLADFTLDTPVWRQVLQSWTSDGHAVSDYAAKHWEPFAWQLLLFLALAALVASLDRQSRRTTFRDPNLAAAARVLRQPYSAGFLVAALTTPWIHSVAPNGLLEFVGLAIVPPVLRLLPREFRQQRDGRLAAATALYLFSSLAAHVDRSSDVHRILVLIDATAGLLLLLKFFKPPEAWAHTFWSFLLWIGRRAMIVGLSIAIAANVLGNANLADLFTGGFLHCGFMAAILYAVVRVLDGVMTMLPRTGALGAIDLVRRNAPMFARRGIGLVRLLAFFAWSGFALRFFQIRDAFLDGVREVLAASWRVGSLDISAGNIVVFLIAVTLTIATARSLQFLLRNDVLPRLNLPRGVPGAISSATQYLVLGLGFLISLAVAGVDLGSIALVAGGLGVGIGFGLQNIVNNFVSGLILLFERPVREGDFIESAKTFGEVKRIGFRSSTIRTWEGSEVIVPNADLISSNVTNWTLADTHRRMDIPVRAAYGSDPKQIIELLIEVAKAHPNTFDEPAPHVLFLAFGEEALELSLRFWTHFEVGLGTRSEVAIQVEEALRAAGVAAPVPHRVIHLETK